VVLSSRQLSVTADIIPLLWERLGARSYARQIRILIARLRACTGSTCLRFKSPSLLILLFLLPSFFLVTFLGSRPGSVRHLFPPRTRNYSWRLGAIFAFRVVHPTREDLAAGIVVIIIIYIAAEEPPSESFTHRPLGSTL
jgi:hypothetical protein